MTKSSCNDVDRDGFKHEKRKTLSRMLGGGVMFAQVVHGQEPDTKPSASISDKISVVKDLNGRYQRKHFGSGIDVLWEGKLCIHARYCVTGSPAVFAAGNKWDPDDDSVDNLAHVIRQCPTGALKYIRKDGGPQEQLPAVNIMRVNENGPLRVNAEMRLSGVATALRATLCRCGHSANKPFCDNSHIAKGFTATGEPSATNELKIPERRNGILQIFPLTNGPYRVVGSLELCASSGRPIARTVRTDLCRCGKSANKPFCDGSHVFTDFVAPGVDSTAE